MSDTLRRILKEEIRGALVDVDAAVELAESCVDGGRHDDTTKEAYLACARCNHRVAILMETYEKCYGSVFGNQIEQHRKEVNRYESLLGKLSHEDKLKWAADMKEKIDDIQQHEMHLGSLLMALDAHQRPDPTDADELLTTYEAQAALLREIRAYNARYPGEEPFKRAQEDMEKALQAKRNVVKKYLTK